MLKLSKEESTILVNNLQSHILTKLNYVAGNKDFFEGGTGSYTLLGAKIVPIIDNEIATLKRLIKRINRMNKGK